MFKKTLVSALALVAAASSAQAATVYGVDENNNLISFDSSAPGTTLSSVAISGTTGNVIALDIRASNNVLYGLTTDLQVVSINKVTGAITSASSPLALTGQSFGFDFNPTIDRLRLVSNSNQNYVYNPFNGAVTNATSVFYVAGDPNFGKDPNDTANAYMTNSATQYAIDTGNDVLALLGNNAGTLTTVGNLGVNLGANTSFDIRGADAFAQNGTGFYRVNLATGATSLIGNADRQLFGIAIGVPEPATWAMMILGLGFVGAMMRRQRTRTRVTYA